MTLRRPHITPSVTVRRLVPDGIQSTNNQLFTNPIPINSWIWQKPAPFRLTPVDATDPSEIWLFAAPASPLIPVQWGGPFQIKKTQSDASDSSEMWLFPPFTPLDWGKQQNNDFLSPVQYPNLNINTVGSPVVPLDWGKQGNIPDYLPPPQYPNLVINTTVQVASPFIPIDLSRPFIPVLAKNDQQELNLNIYTNPIPFAQYDWSKPNSIRVQQPDQMYPDLVLQGFSTPFIQTDWNKGSRKIVLQDQYNNTIVLNQVVAVPFYPVDMSTASRLPSVPSPLMGTNVNLFTNTIPFNQLDWTKLWAVKPIVSDQNNLPNIANSNPSQPSTPLGLFAWVNPGVVKPPVILIPDQDNLPNLVLIVTPPTPPVEDVGGGKWRWLEDYNKQFNKPQPVVSEQIKKAAAVLSSAGGHARAQSLTPKQRSNIASIAAQARWTPKR